MAFDDEDPPFVEPDGAMNELTHNVIGAAYSVYQELGPGLDEGLYESAMSRELQLRGVPFSRQMIFDVHYKGEKIGEKRIDFLVADKLIVELKAVESLTPLHKAQVLTYLKITKRKLGLLINFNSGILKDGIKRIINPSAP
jgi:GxxExxY protein